MPLDLEAVQGDITRANTEAIVNAANNEFWMGSGVAGAIKSAGGEIIEQEAMRKGPVMPGEAVYTTAGRLPFKYVIHAAVMGQDLHTTDTLIRKATVASLHLAEELHLSSITLPAFGTGVGGFPMKACAGIMVTTAYAFESVAEYLRRIQFCLFDAVACKLFQDALGQRKSS